MSGGRALAQAYYQQVVAPLLTVPHAAGRLGSGSDVLGLDDEMSRDHDWGLRLHVLVAAEHVEPVRQALQAGVPQSFRGHPTRFAVTWDDQEDLRVEVMTVEALVEHRLGAPLPRSPADWLALPGQAVLEITAGPVFADQTGELTRVRAELAWYPRDVWLFTVASDLQRIAQELPQIGRAAERDDDLGSRVLTARVAQAVMHLGFLVERRWPPYPKWFGTAYADLEVAQAALPELRQALKADWPERQAHLARALETTYRGFPEAGLPGDEVLLEGFFERPYLRVRDAALEALTDAIADPGVRELPLVGSVEQWVSSVDVLTKSAR